MSEGGRGGGRFKEGVRKGQLLERHSWGGYPHTVGETLGEGGRGGVRGGDWGWGRGYGLRDLHINTRIARITIITRLLEYWISYNNF